MSFELLVCVTFHRQFRLLDGFFDGLICKQVDRLIELLLKDIETILLSP